MKINNAIILCAGKSTRFGRNKLLEKINGLTLPQYCIGFCIKNKIKNIYISLNKDDIYMNRDLLNIEHPIKKDIEYIDNSEKILFNFQNDNEYGPAAGIKIWKDIIKEPFIVLFGDNYYDGVLPEFDFKENDVYISYLNKDVHPRNLQLASIINDYVIEKPHGQLNGKFFCGYTAFSEKVFTEKYIDKIRISNRNEYEITDLINFLPKRKFIENNLNWMDLTYENDVELLKNLILGKN